MRIGLFGLGEAGAAIGVDLAAGGHEVRGFDPADIPTPIGVERVPDPVACVRSARLILALTASADAKTALLQAGEAIAPSSIYVDGSTAAPTLKRDLAEAATRHGFGFCDLALMSTVPGKGIRTPAMCSGSAGEQASRLLTACGMPIEYVGADAGVAATRKLLRSIVTKGLAGLLIEALNAAEATDLAPWLWRNVSEELQSGGPDFYRRLIEGTGVHHRRRLDEMEAARDLLESLGVTPTMTAATAESLRRVARTGVPQVPSARD